ncbi:hypothetical protein HPB47_004503 [Ixodes persulcatus]|uniref:Uncharacterized protein n=1 Tax=Ixodes persulcatus TaxID=34615 RepID=A0AC60PGM3_IXOPE|nr:hypothetical protein HPB47_004503 [Ixodes persulcatus]
MRDVAASPHVVEAWQRRRRPPRWRQPRCRRSFEGPQCDSAPSDINASVDAVSASSGGPIAEAAAVAVITPTAAELEEFDQPGAYTPLGLPRTGFSAAGQETPFAADEFGKAPKIDRLGVNRAF